jgi:hypothetical protein
VVKWRSNMDALRNTRRPVWSQHLADHQYTNTTRFCPKRSIPARCQIAIGQLPLPTSTRKGLWPVEVRGRTTRVLVRRAGEDPAKWTPLHLTARAAPSSGSTTRRDTISSLPRTHRNDSAKGISGSSRHSTFSAESRRKSGREEFPWKRFPSTPWYIYPNFLPLSSTTGRLAQWQGA